MGRSSTDIVYIGIASRSARGREAEHRREGKTFTRLAVKDRKCTERAARLREVPRERSPGEEAFGFSR